APTPRSTRASAPAATASAAPSGRPLRRKAEAARAASSAHGRRNWRQLALIQLRRLDRHALAAAAGVGLVGIVESEPGGEPAHLVVDLGADQEQHRLGVHDDVDSLVLHDLVEWLG